jgi:hypothetical protein
MMDFKKHALILATIEKLREYGSRTGKTHVMKALWLATARGDVELPLRFFLYKHGPYSTEIESNLEQMASYGAITVEPAFDGYGVVLSLGPMADYLKQRVALPADTEQAIERVCRFIGSKTAGQLERLATAAWIRTQEAIDDPDAVAIRLHELKPHISIADAFQANRELMSFFSN